MKHNHQADFKSYSSLHSSIGKTAFTSLKKPKTESQQSDRSSQSLSRRPPPRAPPSRADPGARDQEALVRRSGYRHHLMTSDGRQRAAGLRAWFWGSAGSVLLKKRARALGPQTRGRAAAPPWVAELWGCICPGPGSPHRPAVLWGCGMGSFLQRNFRFYQKSVFLLVFQRQIPEAYSV